MFLPALFRYIKKMMSIGRKILKTAIRKYKNAFNSENVLTDTKMINKINVIIPIIIREKIDLKFGGYFDLCVSFNLLSFLG